MFKTKFQASIIINRNILRYRSWNEQFDVCKLFGFWVKMRSLDMFEVQFFSQFLACLIKSAYKSGFRLFKHVEYVKKVKSPLKS